MNRIFLVIGMVAALCISAGQAWSQSSYGKITGRVTDASGEILPGANVVIEDTRFGATSDSDGFYVMIGVEPGLYKLKASMVGYEAVVRQGVKVAAGLTTVANFTLRESAIEAAEIVVTAERPLVEVDRTSSETKISSQEIAQVPIIRDVRSHLQYAVGTNVNDSPGNGVRIRHMSYYSMRAAQTWTFDGIELMNLDTSQQTAPRQYTNLPVTSIGEMGLVRGGADASQASSPAGVINIVSREGSRIYRGGIDLRIEPPGRRHRGANVYDATPGQAGGANGYWRDKLQWNNPEWVNETDPETGQQIHVRQDYEGAIGHLVEGWVSGPLADNVTFVLSGKTSRSKQTLPGPTRVGLRQNSVFGKLSFTPTSNLKLKVGYNHSNEPTFFGDTNRGVNSNLFLINGTTGYEQKRVNQIFYVTGTHSLSPRMFHEFQVAYFGTKTEPDGTVDGTTTSWRRDALGQFNLDRERRRIVVEDNRRYNLRYDFTGQLTRRNLFKAGFVFQNLNNLNWDYNRSSATNATIKIMAKNSEPGQRYTVNRLAAYVDEKLEFQGMVVHAGLRFDSFWGGPERTLAGFMKALPGWRTYKAWRTGRVPLEQTRPMTSLSPRIGLSHPITDRSTVRYSYGVYYKPPQFSLLWLEPWTTSDAQNHPELDDVWFDLNWIGGGQWRLDGGYQNPGGLPNTAEFEVTGEWNFISDFVMELSTYYRRTERVGSGGVHRFIDPVQTLAYVGHRGPNARLETKGIEVGFTKAFSHNFSFRVGLDVSWALFNWSGGSQLLVHTYPDSNFIAGPNYFTVDANDDPVRLTADEIRTIGRRANDIIRKLQADGTTFAGAWGTNRLDTLRPWYEYPGLSESEKQRMENLYFQDVWRQVDAFRGQPPTTNASFQFLWSTPMDWGGAWRPLLGGVQANLVWRIDNGGQFQITLPGTSVQTARNRPVFVRTDMNVQKSFRIGSVTPTLYMEVFNLFNTYYDSSSGANYIRWGLKTPTPNDSNYLKYGDSNFRRGSTPRYVNLGVRVGF